MLCTEQQRLAILGVGFAVHPSPANLMRDGL